ncbi:hypothetical protein [Deinococcus xianganensis]|uniref:Uncharacterized protein n=1 Tax=Deinococcus xianganensis TaxID=1507289 RepID=A0A6I4YCL8_9DEIO|nr:hypothetical protein [Deinococcus xianganensis]MXV19192.1 hypothetical protein [Deinococcus xianganensis]
MNRRAGCGAHRRAAGGGSQGLGDRCGHGLGCRQVTEVLQHKQRASAEGGAASLDQLLGGLKDGGPGELELGHHAGDAVPPRVQMFYVVEDALQILVVGVRRRLPGLYDTQDPGAFAVQADRHDGLRAIQQPGQKGRADPEAFDDGQPDAGTVALEVLGEEVQVVGPGGVDLGGDDVVDAGHAGDGAIGEALGELCPDVVFADRRSRAQLREDLHGGHAHPGCAQVLEDAAHARTVSN